ncbi:hypothetical protein [Nostoc sp. CALU 1950]
MNLTLELFFNNKEKTNFCLPCGSEDDERVITAKRINSVKFRKKLVYQEL